MRRSHWSAPFLLLLLPDLGGAEGGGHKVYGRDLKVLVSEIADWSSPRPLPRDYQSIYEVSLCQYSSWRAPKTRQQGCHPALYARGSQPESGSIQMEVAIAGDAQRISGDWYQVSPKWRQRLWDQFRYQSPLIDETFIFRSLDVDKLIEEVADRSQEVGPPASYRKTGRFLFCQRRLEGMDAPPPGVESCYVAVFARGSVWKPGSILFVDANGNETNSTSESWFRLTPEWDSLLNRRLYRWADVNSRPLTSTSTSHPDPHYRGCWYGTGENRYVVACD